MAKIVKYVGAKKQKTVLWLEDRPTWNEGNDWMMEMTDQDASRLLKQCPNIFKVEKTIFTPEPEVEEKTEGIQKVERPAVVLPPGHWGRKETGEPFASKANAATSVRRIVKETGLPKDRFQVVQFADGWCIAYAEPAQAEPEEFDEVETVQGDADEG